LYKYIKEWAAPDHSRKLLAEINNELDNGVSIDGEHAKLLSLCIEKLLNMASPVYCKCGHEIQSHVNFDTKISYGCSGSTPNGKCDCTIFRLT